MTLGSHQKTVGVSQVHITPKHILDALGEFDLDPCGNDPRPWDCARRTYTITDNGLGKQWCGRVWLNPPFDTRQVGLWIEKLAAHGDGMALLHARTETAWFQPIWDKAHGVLFLRGRLIFHRPDGSKCTTAKGQVANSGAPPVLVAFGVRNYETLRRCGLPGRLVKL